MWRSAVILILLAACGARTGLGLEQGLRDAGISDAPPLPPLPVCDREVPVGEVRFRVPDVAGQAIFGADGTLYATVGGARGTPIDLAAFDRCTGEQLWRSPALPGAERAAREPIVRLAEDGTIVLTNTGGYIGGYGLWRFT